MGLTSVCLLTITVKIGACSRLATISLLPSDSSRQYGKGETFTLEINTTSVTDLYVYEFKLNFDPTSINIDAMYPSSGSTDETGFVFTNYFVFGHIINNTTGFIQICVSVPLGTHVGVNTSGCLAKLTVSVVGMGILTNLTFAPRSPAICLMINSDQEDIPVTLSHGTFRGKYHGVGERRLDIEDFYKTHPRTAKLPYNLRGEVKEYFEDGTWTAEPSGDKQKGGKRTRHIQENG